MTTPPNSVCVIVGAGPGNGAALARQFAGAGYHVALLARDSKKLAEICQQVAGAAAFVCDVSQPQEIAQALAQVQSKMGPVEVLVYNVGKGVWGDALSITPEQFESAWRVNALGGFLCAQQVLPGMLARGRGCIIFTGTTASRRGAAHTVAFASAKGAQRLMAESLARAYGPRGVHVALLVIDAVVGEPVMRAQLADRPDDFFCQPQDIAQTAVMLAQQPRSAWTFELEVRPYAEKW